MFSLIVAMLATLSAIVYGYLYLMFTTITTIFKEKYKISPNIMGLTSIGNGVEMIFGVIIFGVISDHWLMINDMEMMPGYCLHIMKTWWILYTHWPFLVQLDRREACLLICAYFRYGVCGGRNHNLFGQYCELCSHDIPLVKASSLL